MEPSQRPNRVLTKGPPTSRWYPPTYAYASGLGSLVSVCAAAPVVGAETPIPAPASHAAGFATSTCRHASRQTPPSTIDSIVPR